MARKGNRSQHVRNDKTTDLPFSILREIQDKHPLDCSDEKSARPFRRSVADKQKGLSRKERRAMERRQKSLRGQKARDEYTAWRRRKKRVNGQNFNEEENKNLKDADIIKQRESESDDIVNSSDSDNDSLYKIHERRTMKINSNLDKINSPKRKRTSDSALPQKKRASDEVEYAQEMLGVSEKASPAKKRLMKELHTDGFDEELLGFLDDIVDDTRDEISTAESFQDEEDEHAILSIPINRKTKHQLKKDNSKLSSITTVGRDLSSTTHKTDCLQGRYIPPHLRQSVSPSSFDKEREAYVRQLNSAINRVSEGNIRIVTQEIAKTFQSAKRCIIQPSLSATKSKLLDNVETKIEEALETLIEATVKKSVAMCILHPTADASLISCQVALLCGLSTLISSKFSAKFVTQIALLFCQHFGRVIAGESTEENRFICRHIVMAVSFFFDFGMLDVGMLYGFLRRLTQQFEETSMNLSVLCLRFVGVRLRAEYPNDFRDILEYLSERTADFTTNTDPSKSPIRFLIQDINNLKNHQMHVAATTTERFGPLRNWLTTSEEFTSVNHASHIIKGDWQQIENGIEIPKTAAEDATLGLVTNNFGGVECQNPLLTKAAELRISLDIQKNLFVAIMGAADQYDASSRILEVVKVKSDAKHAIAVIIHCCINESISNEFYSALNEVLCQLPLSLGKRYQKALSEGIASHLGICHSHTPHKMMNFAHFVAALISKELVPIKILRFLKLQDSVESVVVDESLTQSPEISIQTDDEKNRFARTNLTFLRQIAVYLLTNNNNNDDPKRIRKSKMQIIADNCLEQLESVPDIHQWMYSVLNDVLHSPE